LKRLDPSPNFSCTGGRPELSYSAIIGTKEETMESGEGRTTETTPAIDREAARRELARVAGGGNLTLGEYAERARAIEQAASVDEIESAVRGLPEGAAGVTLAQRPRWIVAVLGGTEQRGRWRLSKRLWLLAALGGATLDLSAAVPEETESTITVIAILGGADVIAPEGVAVQLSGLSLLGGKGDKRPVEASLPGSPLVRVQAFTLLGGVTIKAPTARRNLLNLIRARRRRRTGG
jgi:hypothetical protein